MQERAENAIELEEAGGNTEQIKEILQEEDEEAIVKYNAVPNVKFSACI